MKKIANLHWIIIIICLCLIIQLLISYKLWIPVNREFPLISAFHFLPLNYGIIGDTILYSLMIFGLVSLLFFPFKKNLISIFIFVSVLFVMEDIIRLQPWLYIFGLIIITLVVIDPIKKEDHVNFIIRLILAATYFWSGFQKLNTAFTVEIFPWLMGAFGLEKFAVNHHYLGYILAFIEMLAGIGLLIRRFEKVAGVIIIFIHLFLLIAIGPFGVNWNTVIWPWNIAMIGIIILIVPFKRSEEPHPSLYILFSQVGKQSWFWFVLILTFFAPILNYFRLWDSHLSGSLYSGNNSEAIFYYDKRDREAFPETTRKLQFYYPDSDEEFLMLDQWVIHELDAPFYPEERYFREVGRKLCLKVNDKSKAGIKITMKKKFTSEQSLKDCPCNELLKDL